MADRHVGRAPIGSAVLLIVVVIMIALSRTPLFGLEWLYLAGSKLMPVASDLSPALCMVTIALAGGTVGHRLALKEVADRSVRERWSRMLSKYAPGKAAGFIPSLFGSQPRAQRSRDPLTTIRGLPHCLGLSQRQQMTEVNWNEIVDLELRGVQRADASYRFSPFAAGSLAAMIRRAVSRSERDQPRLAIRSIRLGRLEIGQINELYSRPDFPGRLA